MKKVISWVAQAMRSLAGHALRALKRCADKRIWIPAACVVALIAGLVVKKWWPVWQQNIFYGFASVAATAYIPPPTTPGASPTPTPTATPRAASNASPTSAAPTPSPTPSPSPTPFVRVRDDWNYVDEAVEIHITPYDKNGIQYYVADVKLHEADHLETGFARGKYGDYHENTSTQAERYGAIFAISGDYCGFSNKGIIIRNGELYRERSGDELAAFFEDGTLRVMPQKETDAEELMDEKVLHTWSFGPWLVRDGVMRDKFPSGVRSKNPRTGIGMLEPNHLLFVVVDGRSKSSSGMTLAEFAQLFSDLGCTQAYNLDGGGSATMYFNGRVVNNLMGKNLERAISDIAYIAPLPTASEGAVPVGAIESASGEDR